MKRCNFNTTSAGTRDDAMSCLIGITGRKFIDEKCPVKIEELTDIKPYPMIGVLKIDTPKDRIFQ